LVNKILNKKKGEDMKSRVVFLASGVLISVFFSLFSVHELSAASKRDIKRVYQGRCWTQSEWEMFYIQDQGSRLIPFEWIKALKQPNNPNKSFMDDNLTRYGFLKNPAMLGGMKDVPIGFNVAKWKDVQTLGMTCAACHTRQIDVEKTSYIIDGAPALIDFQSFLDDLDKSVDSVRKDPKAFLEFADAVLGSSASLSKVITLQNDLEEWYKPYSTLVKKSLPDNPWGLGRLDAVSMIFNRVAGLDIGPEDKDYMIPKNIEPATAPVRYPFLWNAPFQDKTQWPGFAENGTDLNGLARNLGEVYGVFAIFHPQPKEQEQNNPKVPLKPSIDYLAENSANFDGLKKLEELTKKIGPPKWPWRINDTLVDKGKTLFTSNCAGCHGKVSDINKNKKGPDIWKTPIRNVGTDSKAWEVLQRKVDTGVLEGESLGLGLGNLQSPDCALNVLIVAVAGSIKQHKLSGITPSNDSQTLTEEERKRKKESELQIMPDSREKEECPNPCYCSESEDDDPYNAYEARVLEGIWAAAPYLHNGSVPTLAELLKPVDERVSSFKVGPAYDTVNVGLAVEQSKFGDYTLETTDCSQRNSGNSRCGHEYGTNLSPDEKKALLEYLKTL
jgi:hypothetical protein